MNKIKVEFFGAFKKYGDHAMLELPANSSVAELKNLLSEHLPSSEQLIKDSAIACNDTIVNAGYKIQQGETIAILPPVCGG
jgi:molybdopterin converting factor small subunit